MRKGRLGWDPPAGSQNILAYQCQGTGARQRTTDVETTKKRNVWAEIFKIVFSVSHLIGGWYPKMCRKSTSFCNSSNSIISHRKMLQHNTNIRKGRPSRLYRDGRLTSKNDIEFLYRISISFIE